MAVRATLATVLLLIAAAPARAAESTATLSATATVIGSIGIRVLSAAHAAASATFHVRVQASPDDAGKSQPIEVEVVAANTSLAGVSLVASLRHATQAGVEWRVNSAALEHGRWTVIAGNGARRTLIVSARTDSKRAVAVENDVSLLAIAQ